MLIIEDQTLYFIEYILENLLECTEDNRQNDRIYYNILITSIRDQSWKLVESTDTNLPLFKGHT